MNRGRRLGSPLVVMIMAVAAVSLAPASIAGRAQAVPRTAADTSRSPRTPWGDPDLQGVWSAGYILTPLERPAKYAGREFLTDEEVAALEKEARDTFGKGGGAASGVRLTGGGRPQRGTVEDVAGAYNDVFSGRGTRVVRTKRTSLIVDPPDGKIPALTPEGQKRVGSRGGQIIDAETGPGGRADNPEERGLDRCLGATLPLDFGSAAVSGGYLRIVQTPGYVSIYYEDGHHGGVYRTISLDGRPHLPPQIRQWLGDARGHWEGDTLVVDTTNFTNQTNFRGSKENLHLIERFIRAADDMFMYRVTIDDPTTFTQRWTIEVPYSKSDERKNQIFEAACHEGNYALTGILAGARVQEREKAAAAKKKAASK